MIILLNRQGQDKGKNNAKSEFKDFATFETLITPKIITIVYWLATILLIAGTILSWLQQREGVSISFAVSLIATRVIFELIMVSFKIMSTYAESVKQQRQKKQSNRQRSRHVTHAEKV